MDGRTAFEWSGRTEPDFSGGLIPNHCISDATIPQSRYTVRRFSARRDSSAVKAASADSSGISPSSSIIRPVYHT